MTDLLHHLAQLDELMADGLIVGIQASLLIAALSQLGYVDALGLGGKMVPVMERRPCRSSRLRR